MKVDLIADTFIHWETVANLGYTPSEGAWSVEDADALAEFSGRSCYQSWDNPSGRSTAEYLANIISQGHFSVLEHASATFYIQGVSRALTHELIRHRHLSYSQLSQRFVNESSAEFVTPPALRGEAGDHNVGVGEDLTVNELIGHVNNDLKGIYSTIVTVLQDRGFTRKQAREAGRAVLPNMTETKIVVTGNHRAWRDFLTKRWSVHADAEIQELAGQILGHLRTVAPSNFSDIPETPYP